jgi:hypothetical protein
MVSAIQPITRIGTSMHRRPQSAICEHGHRYFGVECPACKQQKIEDTRPWIYHDPEYLLDSAYINAINYQSAMICHGSKQIND